MQVWSVTGEVCCLDVGDHGLKLLCRISPWGILIIIPSVQWLTPSPGDDIIPVPLTSHKYNYASSILCEEHFTLITNVCVPFFKRKCLNNNVKKNSFNKYSTLIFVFPHLTNNSFSLLVVIFIGVPICEKKTTLAQIKY